MAKGKARDEAGEGSGPGGRRLGEPSSESFLKFKFDIVQFGAIKIKKMSTKYTVSNVPSNCFEGMCA